MLASVFVLCLLPLAVRAVPCTDPSTTTTTTAAPTTTENVPPPAKFPQGTYALIRPEVGCPLSTGFKTFFRYWDTEDYRNANSWPATNHFMGFMKSDGYKMYMCVKTNPKGGGNYEWPAGDYCIIKKGDCPNGFSEGSISWDDENKENQNARTSKKTFWPSGVFNENTKIDFCCRNDGSASTAIKLPVRRAFYLMRYKGECQKVAEMTATEEAVYWDDEDTSNTDSKSGSHPMDSGTSADHKLHFCYYEPTTPQ